MGAESTWFDLLPGLRNLEHTLAFYLGRETPDEKFYFRWQMFGPSHFTMAHVYGALIVLLLALLAGLWFRRSLAREGDKAVVPPAQFGARNLVEMFTDAVLSVSEGVMGAKNARRFLPLIGSLAVFIFFSNILALIPGFIPPTATLKTNVALALSVFVLTHFFGFKEHGLSYVKEFMGPIWWLAPLMLPIELVSHLARPVSLSLRLLGNIAADHMVVSAFFVMVPLLVPVPFLLLGVLVSIVQALVFCLLTMVYIEGALAHEEGDH